MEMEEEKKTLSLHNHKKIIFCGPAAAGKTSLKEIFFEKANPLRLLNATLEPTKGYERGVYHQIQNEIAVFDLGGQENKRWFGEDQRIFEDADFILCVCPVTTPLNEIAAFIYLLTHTIRTQCPDGKLIFLYHKRDLIPVVELTQRIRSLRQFFKLKTPEILNQFTLYVTSIAEPFFFATYRIFAEILTKILTRQNIFLKTESYQQAELALRILLEFQPGVKFHINILISRFHVSLYDAHQALSKLNGMEFVNFFYIPNVKILESFRITEQARIFITSIKRNLIYPNKLANNIRSSQRIFDLFSQLKKEKG